MNVFEDLIEELKEENLLERTITELANEAEQDDLFTSSPPTFENGQAFHQLPDPAEDILNEPILEASHETASETSATPYVEAEPQQAETAPDVPEIKKPQSPREFLRKRAMEEVTSLQMVEHVLSGVEREHMRKAPEPFDDLEVKKALHKFLQLTDNPKSQECSDAEFELLQETQKWYSVLAERDSAISPANIRRFCENSRPALSSQALIALARFYRNSPFSEAIRGKFDFVMTRLFTREIDDEKRRLLFERRDMVGHIKTLYDNWSSISLFSTDENESDFAQAIARLREFAEEAEAAPGLDELLKTKIFDRIREYKEELGEMFFVSDVLAEAIDTNIRIGNRFLHLADEVRYNVNLAKLEEKYGTTLDQLVSDTTGKTVLFSELFDTAELDLEDAVPEREFNRRATDNIEEPVRSRISIDIAGVNKWLLAATIIVVMISAGIYFWADRYDHESTAAEVAATVELDGSDLAQFLVGARSTEQTLYGMTQPSWETLSEAEKMDFLKRAAAFADKRGLKRVNLLNKKGRTVAYAVGDRFELLGPS
ncbi:MAG TPA: hypothetical protein PKD24_13355 [Pyrinomonadaceae bacterium]|nr:hypothetical protein [Pyrinomonadaceae bacterium]HMP66327.1 hypothetical protein [Pyrinomonadaceae bacterium]